ncbi:hypothetical protein G6F22_008217 [Rhizopus arrhizus]|nr:hypothetical protein G6F22_008217 [Rhizopus arrhizus]
MSRSDETGWYSSGCQAEPLPQRLAPRRCQPKFAPTFNAPQPVILHEAVQHRLTDQPGQMRAPLRAVQAAPAIACGLAGRGALQHLGQRLAELRQEYGALCTHPPMVLERKQVPGLQQAFGNGHGMYTGQVPVARACLAQRRHAARRSSGAGWRAVGNPQDTFQHVRDLGGRQPMVAMAALRDGDQQIAFDQATQMRARRLRRHPGHTCQFHRGVGAAIHQLQQHRGACLVPDQGADTDKGTGGVDHAGIVACKARPTVRCRPKHHPPSPAHSGRPVSRENCCDPPSIRRRRITPSVLYPGTPVVLMTTLNPDGSSNISPLSSFWALGNRVVLGLGTQGQGYRNLQLRNECVLNFPCHTQAAQVEAIARATGRDPVPDAKQAMGYVHIRDKFALGGFSAVPPQAMTMGRAS